MTEERAPKEERIHDLLRAAWSHHREGELRKARRLYRRALEIDPGHPDANNLLGLLWLQSGQAADAVTHIETALIAQPENAQSHFNMGQARTELGQLERACQSFNKAYQLQPDNFDALFNLAHAKRMLGRPAEAHALLHTLLEKKPDHAKALSSLGFLELTRQDLEQAEKLFRRALEISDADPRASGGLAEALASQRQDKEAEEVLRKALEKHPKSSNLHNDLGAMLNRSRRAKSAISHLIEALKLDPMHAQARLNLGLVLEQSGHLGEAEQAYLDTIRTAPSFVDAHFQLARLHGRQSTPDEINALRALHNATDVPEATQAMLSFALGYALESVGEHDDAFAAWQEGHRLKAIEQTFSLESAVKSFSRLRNFFSSERIAQLQAGGVPDERPVFVVGMPRSGTTLAEQILASHAKIEGAGETGLLGVAASRLEKQLRTPYPEGLDTLPAKAFRKEAETLLSELERRVGAAQRMVDTTPMNFLQLGLAAALFPDVRIVHCRRDPMDNGLSIFKQVLAEAHSYAHDLRNLGHFYLLYEELMSHWQEVIPGKIYDLHYETLVAEPESEIRRLLEFCGMPYDANCIEFHTTDRVLQTPAAGQVRQPLHTHGVGSWRRYQQPLEPLRRVLQADS